MRIRNEQIDALNAARREAFEAELIEELRESFPQLRRVRGDSLLEYVRDVEAKSMVHGLETATQIKRLAIYEMGARLHLKGLPPWLTAMLSCREIAPANRLRMIGLRLEHELELLE